MRRMPRPADIFKSAAILPESFKNRLQANKCFWHLAGRKALARESCSQKQMLFGFAAFVECTLSNDFKTNLLRIATQIILKALP
ncbi:MAG: hypothetical protein IPM81_02755 [Saprospirales bacterium]|nr:hypothetical protein [Saprospirales bacterium]